MLGNFAYCNPTKLYFGEDSLKFLNEELPKYGENILLVYGGGSIKKNGIYDAVTDILKKNGKNVAEIRASCLIQRWKSCMREWKSPESTVRI